jgi:hypothetical protein
MLALLEAAPPSADLYGATPDDRSVELLAERIALHIESLVPRGRARCLEIGSGDTAIAEAIHDRLERTAWRCCDVPASSGLRHEPRCSEYRAFDGDMIPYGDAEFDVAVLSDVLRDAPEHAARLLAEAARVARYVLVTDRFERELYWRTSRRLTREAFIRLANQQSLVITAFDSGLGTVAQATPHFVAVLCRA